MVIMEVADLVVIVMEVVDLMVDVRVEAVVEDWLISSVRLQPSILRMNSWITISKIDLIALIPPSTVSILVERPCKLSPSSAIVRK